MPRTRIKICGVRDVDTALAAARAGADAVGLVFVQQSPRCVTVDEADRIVRALPAFVEPVALFVDANVDQVFRSCEAIGVRTVQLHGGETPTYVEQLIGLRVIKSVSFEAGNATSVTDAWSNAPGNVAALLWDAPPADDAVLTGGSGAAFDWSALTVLRDSGKLAGLPPMIVAGGLTPANVADAVATLRPYGVDVSSGVEASRGVKDATLIQAFCHAVRVADERANTTT